MVDVEFPIDVVVLTRDGLREHRFDVDDLAETHEFWHNQLRVALAELPTGWVAPLLSPLTADREPE